MKVAPMESTGPIKHSLTSASMPRSLIILQESVLMLPGVKRQKNLLPSILRSSDVALSVKRDVAECVSVQELDSPVEDANQTAQDAKQNRPHHVAITGSIALSGRAELTKSLDDSYKQTSKTDTAEAVGHGPLESTAGRALWHGVRVEIPGAVYAGDGSVDCVLQPFGDPVHGEGNENQQANHFAVSAITDTVSAVRIGTIGCILNVDGDQCDGVPCAQCSCEQSSDQRYDVGMSVLLRHVDGSLQHKDAERDPGNPADEAENVEDAEQQENNASRPVSPGQHVDCRNKTEDDVEYAGDPDELLGELARSPHVCIAEDGG